MNESARTAFRMWGRRAERCAVRSCRVPSPDPHHLRTRGIGGRARTEEEIDVRNVVWLCRVHHNEVGQKGPSWFEGVHRIDLEGEAVRAWERWENASPADRAYFQRWVDQEVVIP